MSVDNKMFNITNMCFFTLEVDNIFAWTILQITHLNRQNRIVF